jgi:hypothetical protein
MFYPMLSIEAQSKIVFKSTDTCAVGTQLYSLHQDVRLERKLEKIPEDIWPLLRQDELHWYGHGMSTTNRRLARGYRLNCSRIEMHHQYIADIHHV